MKNRLYGIIPLPKFPIYKLKMRETHAANNKNLFSEMEMNDLREVDLLHIRKNINRISGNHIIVGICSSKAKEEGSTEASWLIRQKLPGANVVTHAPIPNAPASIHFCNGNLPLREIM